MAPLLRFTDSHRSSLSRGNGSVSLVESALVSSEGPGGFLASQFNTVECGSRARWVASWAQKVES